MRLQDELVVNIKAGDDFRRAGQTFRISVRSDQHTDGFIIQPSVQKLDVQNDGTIVAHDSVLLAQIAVPGGNGNVWHSGPVTLDLHNIHTGWAKLSFDSTEAVLGHVEFTCKLT